MAKDTVEWGHKVPQEEDNLRDITVEFKKKQAKRLYYKIYQRLRFFFNRRKNMCLYITLVIENFFSLHVNALGLHILQRNS